MKNSRLFVPIAHLTRRLVFKIFLAFWISMTLAGTILLWVETTRTGRITERWRSVTGDAFTVYATSVAKDHEDPNTGTSREFLTDLQKRTQIRAWLYDAQGREVSGHALAQRRRHPSWLVDRMRQLVKRARTSNRTEFEELQGVTLAARAAPAESGRIYVLVGTLSASRYDFWGAEPRVQSLRLLAILTIAGLVSWVLAHHLTQPLEVLRAATQRLAKGDFSSRALLNLDRRRDEVARLAADFNSMAERIEILLSEQERLVVAQRRLLSDVAHELRSPLARATVALELARDALCETNEANCQDSSANQPHQSNPPPLNGSRDLHPVADSLDRIERETGRLGELIDRLLVLSRLESGVQQPEQARIDLAALVRAVAADADFEARSRGRSVQVPTCERCTTTGTSLLLRSAIENVVRNALLHTSENSIVQVILQCENNDEDSAKRWQGNYADGNCYTSTQQQNETGIQKSWAVITVRDQGQGVPKAELSEVFRPFYRTGGARERQNGGAGLGLAITARAVELHGGQYRICNAPEGGLIIELRLPLLENHAALH
jgi:two-component system sensor histidine kinase CpxA